jgi:hypothetical protein
LRCHTETLFMDSHWKFFDGYHIGLQSGHMIRLFHKYPPALISSVSLNMFLQAKSFNNRTFSEDVVRILCSLYFFHVPHSLWDNKTKGEKCATNFARCLFFLTYFLPCVISCQLSPNILFTSLLKYLQSVKSH